MACGAGDQVGEEVGDAIEDQEGVVQGGTPEAAVLPQQIAQECHDLGGMWEEEERVWVPF